MLYADDTTLYIYTVKKTKYLIFVFKNMTKYMLTHTLRMIYYALFRNIATYRIIAYGVANNNLQCVQTKILKIVCNNNFHEKKLRI